MEVPRDTAVLLLQPRRKSGLPASGEGEHRSVSLAAPRVRFELDTPLESFLNTLIFGALMLMFGFVASIQGAPENFGALLPFMVLPLLWVTRMGRGRYPHRSIGLPSTSVHRRERACSGWWRLGRKASLCR